MCWARGRDRWRDTTWPGVKWIAENAVSEICPLGNLKFNSNSISGDVDRPTGWGRGLVGAGGRMIWLTGDICKFVSNLVIMVGGMGGRLHQPAVPERPAVCGARDGRIPHGLGQVH